MVYSRWNRYIKILVGSSTSVVKLIKRDTFNDTHAVLKINWIAAFNGIMKWNSFLKCVDVHR